MPTASTSDFWARWNGFVRAYTDGGPRQRADLVAQVLASGLDDTLATVDIDPFDDSANALVDPADRWTCEHDVILQSGLFEEFGYVWHNPELLWSLCGHTEGLRHFVRHGWLDLRNPSPAFDVWWYWLTYLDPSDAQVNPFVHYLAEGRHRGHGTVPPVAPMRDRPAPPPADGPRRICLFAGFDGDGTIDDTAVTYVRELSRFADVYYLADCDLEEGELDKLAPWTHGRWAIRHGRYDFGSYSMLARDLVGWETIETYDELLLANDSCYLLRPLDEVFGRMDRRPAHWWGLQATDDDFTPGDMERLGRRLRLDDLASEAREVRPWRMSDCFHVGSYFLALRSEVIADPAFRRRLDMVAVQSDKNSIIRKYEIGLSSFLTLSGYRLETFVDGVLPFHPVYRRSIFQLIAEGFPFLKRQFLHENPFHVPDLDRWKERVLALAPQADVEAMEENLWRVSPTFNLQRALDVHTLPNGSVAMPELAEVHNFHELERWAPRFDHWWAFAVDPVTLRLEGNARAVFEAVRHDPTIKKIVLVRPGSPRPGGSNVAVSSMETQESVWYLMRAATIFVSEGPRADVPQPLPAETHQYVGLRRGTPLLSFGMTVPVDPDGDRTRHNESVHDLDLTRFMCASSPAQKRAMAVAVRSPTPPRVWVTGSPRTDLLVGEEQSLAGDLRAQLATLRRATGGRPLVVWAPADRGNGRSLPTLDAEDLHWLRGWADRNDAVVAVRPPSARPGRDTDGWDRRALRAAGLLVLSPRIFPDVEMVLREAAALVSDYTSELLDYLVLDRPVLAYVPDLAEVAESPGLLHDLTDVVPGPICRNRTELRAAWEGLLAAPTPDQVARHAEVRDRLHAHRDGRNGARVARRVRSTYLPIKAWLAEES